MNNLKPMVIKNKIGHRYTKYMGYAEMHTPIINK